MKRIPTDLAILSGIYERYYPEFAAYTADSAKRSSKIYVPVDLEVLARQFDVDADIVFGRLYYHLNEKYGYEQGDGSSVPFFALRAGQDRHCVNFPYLASVLADLTEENRKYRVATGLAVISLAVSIIALALTVF